MPTEFLTPRAVHLTSLGIERDLKARRQRHLRELDDWKRLLLRQRGKRRERPDGEGCDKTEQRRLQGFLTLLS